MKKFLIVLLVIIALVVLVLGYLGFVPWLSSLMGTNKPRDLGVNPTFQDFTNAKGKAAGIKFEALENAGKRPIQYGNNIGLTKVNASLSSEEFTSMLMYGSWNKWPVDDAQVRFNPDGTAEASGMLTFDRIGSFAGYIGLSQDVTQKVMETLKISGDVPFYIKTGGSITNNKVNLNIQKVEVGRLPVPTTLVDKYQGDVSSFIQGGIGRMKGVSVNSLKNEGGSLKFDGNLPDRNPHW